MSSLTKPLIGNCKLGATLLANERGSPYLRTLTVVGVERSEYSAKYISLIVEDSHGRKYGISPSHIRDKDYVRACAFGCGDCRKVLRVLGVVPRD